ncbi:MAG: response regulator [Congregibacter sp.]|nr:response regulator [Congregibacter sp.]MDP5071961.1 response regulator [Congregibacter sp.]
MSQGQVLIVEDEPKIAQLLVDYLERDDFTASVLHEGSHAVETVRADTPDLLIVDLMLPGKDGLSICREVRQFSDVPIIILTAKVDEIDRLVGLELGADDYICKPFSPREVVARVRTILRRVSRLPAVQSENTLSYGEVTLHSDRYECIAAGERVELTPVEFRLLHGLLEHPGRVYSRDKLMDLCYADERVVSDRTIDTHVKNLRKKLEGSLGHILIHSIYGVGYKVE